MAPKRKVLLTVSAIVLVVGLGILGIVFSGIREPSNGGRSLSEWLADLESNSPKTRLEATHALRAIGTNAIPYLVNELEQEDGKFRVTIARLLKRQSLIKVNFPTPEQRWRRALLGFQALEDLGIPAIPLLVPLLDTGRASTAMSYAGTNALPHLFKALESTNPWIANPVAPDLINMVYRGKALPADLGPALPAALQMLQSYNESSRWQAAKLLGVMGGIAREAVPLLTTAISRETVPSVKEEMIEALANIDPEGNNALALADIRSRLQSSNVNLRIDAVMSLINLPKTISNAVPIFATALNDSNRTVRVIAAEGLGQFRSQPELSVPALIKALQDPDPTVQLKAAASLRYHGPVASNAIPALKVAAQSSDAGVRGNAESALSIISGIFP